MIDKIKKIPKVSNVKKEIQRPSYIYNLHWNILIFTKVLWNNSIKLNYWLLLIRQIEKRIGTTIVFIKFKNLNWFKLIADSLKLCQLLDFPALHNSKWTNKYNKQFDLQIIFFFFVKARQKFKESRKRLNLINNFNNKKIVLEKSKYVSYNLCNFQILLFISEIL